MGKHAGAYKSEKRKKELQRKKKQEEKRQKRVQRPTDDDRSAVTEGQTENNIEGGEAASQEESREA